MKDFKYSKSMLIWSIGEVLIGVIFSGIVFYQHDSVLAGIIGVLISVNGIFKAILKAFPG